jgi:hypothetical protein
MAYRPYGYGGTGGGGPRRGGRAFLVTRFIEDGPVSPHL